MQVEDEAWWNCEGQDGTRAWEEFHLRRHAHRKGDTAVLAEQTPSHLHQSDKGDTRVLPLP